MSKREADDAEPKEPEIRKSATRLRWATKAFFPPWLFCFVFFRGGVFLLVFLFFRLFFWVEWRILVFWSGASLVSFFVCGASYLLFGSWGRGGGPRNRLRQGVTNLPQVVVLTIPQLFGGFEHSSHGAGL